MAKPSSSSISFEQIQNITSRIYDAALDEGQWADVLDDLAYMIHAEQGIMRMLNSESRDVSHVHTFNKNHDWTQAYIDHYVHNDPWIDIFMKSKQTMLECTHHLLSDKEYKASDYYTDFVAPQDMHYGIGGRIDIKNEAFCYMSFQRGKKRGGFEQHYLDVLRGLVPHIQKAVLINKKMHYVQFERDLLKDTLSQVNSSLLLVNKYGQIIFINSLAEQLIEQHANVSIKQNCIFIHSDEENKKLQKLIHQATIGSTETSLKQSGSMCCGSPASRFYLSFLVAPVNPERVNIDTIDENVAVVLLDTNSRQISLTSELLTGLYNLTWAEARLTLHLCEGLTLDEISEQCSVSKNTLKTQLRSCFNKTGVSKQSELINLVNAGPVGIIKIT